MTVTAPWLEAAPWTRWARPLRCVLVAVVCCAHAGLSIEAAAEEAALLKATQDEKLKMLSDEERSGEEMRREAKRSYEKKQRAVMEKRKPEASLFLMRRDEATGQLRMAGGEDLLSLL